MSHDHSHGHGHDHSHDHEHTHHHSHNHQVPWDAMTAGFYEPGWSSAMLRRLVHAAELVANDVVVDADCGDGTALRAAAAWVVRGRLIGVTNDPDTARAATAGHPVADRFAYQPALPVGEATVLWVIGPVSRWTNPEAAVASLRDALAPGGRLFIGANLEDSGIDPARPGDPMPLRAVMKAAGLRGVEVRRYRDGEQRSVILMATRAIR